MFLITLGLVSLFLIQLFKYHLPENVAATLSILLIIQIIYSTYSYSKELNKD